jgi:hypothetical protein
MTQSLKPGRVGYKASIISSLLAFCLFLAPAGLTGKDKTKNPYKGAPDVVHESGKGNQDVLYTKVKTKPSKAEREFVFRELGIPKKKWNEYVAEYRIPISLGGSNTLSNIEALPKSKAKLKNMVRKELESKVRKKEITLFEAQTRIFNWENEPVVKRK